MSLLVPAMQLVSNASHADIFSSPHLRHHHHHQQQQQQYSSTSIKSLYYQFIHLFRLGL